jgi:hypothetical protein
MTFSLTGTQTNKVFKKLVVAVFPFCLHCAENPIYVFPEMKLRSHVPNSYIHVSVSDLYIPRIGLPIWQQQHRKTDPGYI